MNARRKTSHRKLRFTAASLRLAKARAGLTLGDLAGLLNCSVQTCSNVLNERHSKPDTVVRMAMALNVDPADCWDSEEDAAG